MQRAPATDLDLARPRTVLQILETTGRLYGRFPLLFLATAFVVVVPYDLVVLALSGASPLGQENGSAETALLLTLIDFAIVGPLVSAFQVHAVAQIGERGRPRVTELLTRGGRVLPQVVAAEIIAGILIGVGFLLIVIPGIILALRFAVVAQTAAFERTDWPTSLRRSARLTARNYLRILALSAVVGLIALLLVDLAALVAGTGTRPGQVILGIVVAVITRSFQALALALLYFDLRARETAAG